MRTVFQFWAVKWYKPLYTLHEIINISQLAHNSQALFCMCVFQVTDSICLCNCVHVCSYAWQKDKRKLQIANKMWNDTVAHHVLKREQCICLPFVFMSLFAFSFRVVLIFVHWPQINLTQWSFFFKFFFIHLKFQSFSLILPHRYYFRTQYKNRCRFDILPSIQLLMCENAIRNQYYLFLDV